MRKFHWTVTTLHFYVKKWTAFTHLHWTCWFICIFFLFLSFLKNWKTFFSFFTMKFDFTIFLRFLIYLTCTYTLYVRLIFHSCWKMMMKNFAISCDIINWNERKWIFFLPLFRIRCVPCMKRHFSFANNVLLIFFFLSLEMRNFWQSFSILR